MATKNLKVQLKSNGALLMHSDKLADPLNPATVELKKLTSNRKKTEEIQIEIARLGFFGGLYEEDGVVGIPSVCIEACIKEAAKLKKMGKLVDRSVMIAEPFLKLDYEGPTDINKLWDSVKFRDCRSVVVGQSRVMRYRPRFNAWGLKFDLSFDDEQINADELVGILQDAGSKIGLCDYRPKFGRFTVEKAGL